MVLIKLLKKIGWKVALLIGNLKFSVSLLLIISIVSSLGTVVEQDKSTIFYDLTYNKNNPILGFITSDLILRLGLNQIYRTSWFFLLISLFGSSLISCTITRQIPSLKLAKLWYFFKEISSIKRKGITLGLKRINIQKLSYLLRKKNYNVIQQGPCLYAYKGLIGKIAPIFVHLSMIIILIGSTLSILTNSVSQDMILKGYMFRPQNTVNSGPLSHMSQNFEAYIKDFKISYTDQGTIDQFYSELDIVDSDLHLKTRKTIFVNEPLKYNELTFYQTDWSIGVVSFQSPSGAIDITLQQINSNNEISKFWIGALNPKKEVLISLHDLTGNCPIYNNAGKIIGMGYTGSRLFLSGEKQQITRLTAITGLQTKSDSGINMIYAGFSLLIPSIISSYISYSQIWVIRKGENIYIHAETNRALYYFERFIIQLSYVIELE
jgi:cytochrome c biogenesis protein